MGATHSSGSDGSKLTLADRRYRVSGARAEAVVKRQSTRKLGSVAIVQNEQTEAGTSDMHQDGVDHEDTGDEDDDGGKEGENLLNGDGMDSNKRSDNRQLRQRRLQNFQLTRTENAANATILLTRTQRVLIENSWKRAKKGAAEGGMGARIFHTILIAQPDIKLLFGLEKVPQGRLKYEGQFRRHASLLTRALEYIVKNLQYTEKLDHHFQTLGKKHCQMNGGRAFPTHYWDTFLECITQSVLECDGASGGRQHRCRDTAMAWRSLISFIVQQMRRGFEDERLLRKRFSASLMGLRGVASNALNAAYSSGSERAKAIRGRPRPSIVHQHHSHGSLGSLEMVPSRMGQHPPFSLTSPYGVRSRAASAISPLAIGQPHSSRGSIGPAQSSEEEHFAHLMPQQSGSPSNSSSARSASWCAEVSGEQLKRLQITEEKPTRTARSELNIDNETGEVFYTPRMTTRNFVGIEHIPFEQTESVPKPALAAVQLLLNAASSEGQMLDANRASAAPGILLTRHSFSEFAASEEERDRDKEKAAATEASHKLLGMAQAQLKVDGNSDAKFNPNQPRRLSAL